MAQGANNNISENLLTVLIQRKDAWRALMCVLIAKGEEGDISDTQIQNQEFPRVEYILNAVADWVNRYREAISISKEFQRCGPDEVMQIARDLGASPTELREFARKGPGAADLLQKMLIALKVDPDSFTMSELGVMRDLQRLCTMCAEKKRCARELADGTAAEHFHEFCPNAQTLDALLHQISRGH